MVTGDATNPYTPDWPDDPDVPDLEKTVGLFRALSNANGWTHHDIYALCSDENPDVQPGTDVGQYMAYLTESHELYLEDSGYCWRFYEHMPLSQFPPFTAPGAPDASRVVAMFYTTSHGERLYVVIQDPPAP